MPLSLATSKVSSKIVLFFSLTGFLPSTAANTGRRSTKTWTKVGFVFILLIVAGQVILFPLIASLLERNLNESPGIGRIPSSQHQVPRRRRRTFDDSRTPDGTFNGGPMYLQQQESPSVQSHAHCVGETYRSDAPWQSKSCRFDFLCFNTTAHEFVMFASPEEQRLAAWFQQIPYLHVSDALLQNTTTQGVSIGGVNLKWGKKGIARIQWFPKIVPWPSDLPLQYYALPASTVLMPYHSLNGANPGHLVWDDFFPLYNLLSMFQLVEEDHELLPMRYVLQDGERGLWASCDLREEKTKLCNMMIAKFWSLLVGKDSRFQFSTTLDAAFHENTPGQSDLVCAKTGVAGIGALTDHGLHKAHGWESADYKFLHNFGRGGLLYEFRNYMLENVGISPRRSLPKPYRVVFSQRSSDIFNRNLDFERQIELVKQQIPEAKVENYTLKELSVHEQLEVASQTAVFVSLCGGGAVTAMFLPKGSSAILYYAEDGGTANGRRSYEPALLDWDVFNAMSHLRVHWMPRNSRKRVEDEQALVELVRNELRLIDSGTFS